MWFDWFASKISFTLSHTFCWFSLFCDFVIHYFRKHHQFDFFISNVFFYNTTLVFDFGELLLDLIDWIQFFKMSWLLVIHCCNIALSHFGFNLMLHRLLLFSFVLVCCVAAFKTTLKGICIICYVALWLRNAHHLIRPFSVKLLWGFVLGSSIELPSHVSSTFASSLSHFNLLANTLQNLLLGWLRIVDLPEGWQTFLGAVGIEVILVDT